MYAWLWRHLPGGLARRTATALILLAAVVALLFLVVFPWLDARVPWTEVTVGAPRTASPDRSSP